jgi:hypothetical protein
LQSLEADFTIPHMALGYATSSGRSRQPRAGCLSVFAVPFAGVGVFMAILIGRTLWKAQEARGWREAPAIIQSVGARGGGEESTETKAAYRYEVDGRTYTGTRVSLHRGGDNIGRFQQRAFAELERHRQSGRPFRCYVNPQNAGEAVLYRGVRWEMIGFYALFGALFGGFGFGMLAFNRVARRRAREVQAAREARPNEPWAWNPAWAGGVIRSGSRMEMWFVLLFASIWNAIAWPVALLAMQADQASRPRIYLVLLFPAAGLLLAAWAVRVVRRQLLYGTSLFRMGRVPGVIGGTLRGTVEVPGRVLATDGYRVALRCVRRVTTGSGDNSSTRETVLWEDIRRGAREVQDGNPGHTLLPVLFTVPRDCRPTDAANGNDQVVWRLEVEAAVASGPRYASRFEVPVFVTPDSVDDRRPDEGSPDRYGRRLTAQDAVQDSRIRMETTPGGVRYTFPAARHRGGAFGLTVFFLVWTGIIWAMVRYRAPKVFPILFGLADLAIFWGVLVSWFEWRRFEIAPDGVHLAGGVFGLAGARRLARGEILSVEAAESSQQGGRSYFRIKVRTVDGRRHTVGSGIVGRAAAETLAADIRRRLGLGAEKEGWQTVG